MSGNEVLEYLIECGYTHIAHWPQRKAWEAYAEGEDSIPDTRNGMMFDGGICIPVDSDGAESLIEEMISEGSFTEEDWEELLGEDEE